MRLTTPLNHVQRYYWGKGWGSKPGRDKTHFNFKIQWNAKSRRKVYEYPQTLPPNVTVEDANQYIQNCLHQEFGGQRSLEEKVHPWPYAPRPLKGLSDDPDYQTRSALVFDRYRKLLDPLNQSLFFTNSVLEGDQQMPESINHLMSNLEIEENFIELMRRRLEWCLSSDSSLRKLPSDRQFPYLDQKPPRVWGITSNRKESNYLRTLYDLSQLLASKLFGFIDLKKISHPYCVVPFERNEKLIVYDLETDFITVSKSDNNLSLFSTTPLITIDKPLASIEPLSWTTCFWEKNIYPTDYSFKLADNHSIQTLYFTHNLLRKVDNTSLVGRAINYCYGYATAVARHTYGDDINNKELTDPIPIQCVFINPGDFSLGFICFQLNTTSFDSSLKNQVWIKSDVLDLKQVIQHFLAFQVNGFVDPITKQMKRSVRSV